MPQQMPLNARTEGHGRKKEEHHDGYHCRTADHFLIGTRDACGGTPESWVLQRRC